MISLNMSNKKQLGNCGKRCVIYLRNRGFKILEMANIYKNIGNWILFNEK